MVFETCVHEHNYTTMEKPVPLNVTIPFAALKTEAVLHSTT